MPNHRTSKAATILIAGGSGYIGSRLATRLATTGRPVRILARSRARVPSSLLETPGVKVVEGDASDQAAVRSAAEGVAVAYYLIHGMAAGGDYARRDAETAEAFGLGAADAGVPQIVYLGALGANEPRASEHIRSRAETADRLRRGGAPVLEFRAGPVVGPGSLPFEMVRYLTERIPVMICPRWVFTQVQPIGLNDVIEYLALASGLPASDEIVEIGGSQQLSYGEMMVRFGALRGLKRWLVGVPVLTPRLSSMWVHLVTPLRGTFARPIIEGLRTEAVVRDLTPARRLFPSIEPVNYDDAVRAVLTDRTPVERPREFLDRAQPDDRPGRRRSAEAEGFVIEERSVWIDAPAATTFQALQQFGHHGDWFAYSWAWRLRGFLDRLLGGAGNAPNRDGVLPEGARVAMWRVVRRVQDTTIVLEAQARMPGQAWMRFDLETGGADRTLLRITWIYRPRGLGGLLYWAMLRPAHTLMFRALPLGVKKAAERDAGEQGRELGRESGEKATSADAATRREG